MARLITFGGLSARNGAVINGVANPRSRLAILAVLAVAGDRGIRREKLAAMFWPDSDEERARTALRQALFTLKRDLGGGEITLGVSDLRLNPEVLTADVTDFDIAVREERFVDAVALYRGPFLDGVFLRESPDFERWVEDQRARLSSEYGRALEREAAKASVEGNYRAAADWWEKRVRHDPLSGRVSRHYMEALVAAGDRERAIRHASIHAQLVRQELEAEPDAELLALAERLRDARGATAPVDGERYSAQRSSVAATVREIGALDPSPLSNSRILVRRSPIRSVLVALALIGLIGTLYLIRGSNGEMASPRSVAVTAFRNQTGDSSLGILGDVIRNDINSGLTESRLADVAEFRAVDSVENEPRGLFRARRRSLGTRWRYVVSGSYTATRDSLLVHVDVSEPSRGTIFRTVSVSLPRHAEPSAIAKTVRSAVLGAIAPRLDPWLSTWADAFTPPSRFDVYDRFAEGLRQPGIEQIARQAALFREAAALDSSFHLAPLWFLFVDEQPQPARDSVIRQLTLRRAAMTEFEQTLLDYHAAMYGGDRRQRFLVSRRLTSLAPGSDWLLWVHANDASALGRSRDAIVALQRIDTAGPWMMRIGGASYWTFVRYVHHAIGEHAIALDAVKRAMKHRPDLGLLRQMELTELAALGRVDDVDRMLTGLEDWSRSTLDGSTLALPFAIAVEEFATHGHIDHAKRVSTRLDSMLVVLPDSLRNKSRMLNVRARVLMALDRPEEAVQVLHKRSGEWGWEALGLLALASAAARNAAAADSALNAMMAKSVHLQVVATRARAAQVYALLGDRERAMASLRQALLQGTPWIPLQHDRPAADSLRRYPTAEALIRDSRQAAGQ